ncbi:hypothetical protein BV898_10216 [Hypsibius exemplaris]|uniref:Chitin-binding type-2 domain-containing protein n=1 Tax=Hypsibius exemplaris TaxID=2072580 RepID=A0A1W0WKC3_HYPEX|nr:hypothetical protein BV898_10216 [Hypsibius exemplaris]
MTMDSYIWIFGAFFGVTTMVNGQSGGPSASEALDALRGRAAYFGSELRALLASAQPGTAYPTLSAIPQTSFSCDKVQQPGFYADPETQCQVYRRCDPNAPMASFLCPNGTLFNGIALVCDYWYNVQCSRSAQFDNYSNPRIYGGPNVRLLTDSNTINTGSSQDVSSNSNSFMSSSGSSSSSHKRDIRI